MHSPAESQIETASSKLDAHQRAEALVERAREIAGNIDAAFAAMPRRGDALLHDYAQADGDKLDIVATHRFAWERSNRVTNPEYLDIKGRLSRDATTHPAPQFNMYRIGMVVPTTDGGYLSPHYEISVADPESESGFTPLALVEQSVLNRKDDIHVSGSSKLAYDIFDVHNQLSEQEFAVLKDTGIYVNPHSQAMLEEVQHITGLIASQATAVKPQQAA